MTNLSRYQRLPFYLAFAAAACGLVSIAASQILLGLAVLAVLVFRVPVRYPPVLLPLGGFIAGTLLSAAWAGDMVGALPQIKKFYVLLTLVVVYSVFRTVREARWLVLAWGAVAALSAAVSLVQFFRKWEQAERLGEDFYQYYVGERISGLMSHWMTLGGQEMMVLLLLCACLFFQPPRWRGALLVGLAGLVIWLSLVLGFTRTIWLGAALGGLYLVWFWKRKLLLAVPVLLLAVIALGPASLRSRLISAVQPHGERDSNMHRVYCFRTGWEMIKDKPLLGVGPEKVGRRFLEYLPGDLKLPLPEGYYGHLHNLYIHYAAERGVPTMLMLVWFLGKALWDFWRGARKPGPPQRGERFLLHGAAACTLAVAASGLFEVNLGDSEVLAMFLTVVALGYVALDAATRRAEEGLERG